MRVVLDPSGTFYDIPCGCEMLRVSVYTRKTLRFRRSNAQQDTGTLCMTTVVYRPSGYTDSYGNPIWIIRQ